MDPLFFGELDHPRQRWLFEGVVGGISSYGNSVGVPTVGGELTFDPCYEGNPLVNVLCMGALPVGRLVLGRASGVGNLAVLSAQPPAATGSAVSRSSPLRASSPVRSTTTSARACRSATPTRRSGSSRPASSCSTEGSSSGIQDLGGAGLACATSETAARAGLGMDVDVAAVPRRESGMVPAEVMTSESQERMLAIVSPQHLDDVSAVCARWEVAATVVGRVTQPVIANGGSPVGRLRIRDGLDGPVLGDVPASALADDAPRYDRPRAPARRTTTRGSTTTRPLMRTGDRAARTSSTSSSTPPRCTASTTTSCS